MLDSISVLIDALSKAISSKLLSYVDRRELLDHHVESGGGLDNAR